MPTNYGTTIFKDNQPSDNAKIIDLLEESGAIIMGKTVTTEFAFFQPSKTLNPHNIERSPGGSSSGSAAAVAANHVPLTIGTQTNGSIIRPASFCGVHGFKPSKGAISRSGVLQTSQTLDQIGCFARSLDDIALISGVLGSDVCPEEENFYSANLNELSNLSVSPNFAWLELSFYDRLEASAKDGFLSILNHMGINIKKIDNTDRLSKLVDVHTKIY